MTRPCILLQVNVLRYFWPKEKRKFQGEKIKVLMKNFQISMFWGQFYLSLKLNFFKMHCTIYTLSYAYNQINTSWFQEQERYCTTLASYDIFYFGLSWSVSLATLHTKPDTTKLSSITFLVLPSISRAWNTSLWPALIQTASCFQLRTVWMKVRLAMKGIQCKQRQESVQTGAVQIWHSSAVNWASLTEAKALWT